MLIGKSTTPKSARLAAQRRAISPVWAGIGVLAVLTLIFTTTQSSFSVFTFDSVLLASMGAISLQVLQGTAGLTSVGSAAFLLFGAFGAVFMLRAGIPFPADILLAAVVSGIVGLVTAVPALRLRSLYLALATLSVYFIAVYLGDLYQSHVPAAEQTGFFLPTLFGSYGISSSTRYWAWLLLGVVSLVIIGAARLMGSKTGRALRMMREHELIAPMFGIAVVRYKFVIFGLSSFTFGLEGALMAHFTGNVSSDGFPISLAFEYIVMVMVGGLDSVLGAVIGAAIVTALPAWMPNILSSLGGLSNASTYSPDIAEIVYGVLVIIFVTASPDGVVGLLRIATSKLTALLQARRRPTQAEQSAA
jgi:branched-chain amino acid transport system permease protein